jgi:hypothetical protein
MDSSQEQNKALPQKQNLLADATTDFVANGWEFVSKSSVAICQEYKLSTFI